MTALDRRTLLRASGLVSLAALTGCSTSHQAHSTHPSMGPVPSASPLARKPGQGLTTATLRPSAGVVDLGGVEVQTWSYDAEVPGSAIRATAGDLVRVQVHNQLPDTTSVHWHGIRLREVADGVPGVTQDPIPVGGRYTYEFVAPDPGTYFFHPHSGLQLDRGLYAPLIIDDPREPGEYDDEWVVVLDDWLDGTGTTPDQVLTKLIKDGGSAGGHDMSGMGGMEGMDHSGGMGHMGEPPFGPGGDVTYPHYLINGRVPTAPRTFRSRSGRRVRLRVINAGSDTIFRLSLAGHRLTVTHTDGWPVRPTVATAVYLGMGERIDALVTLGSGAFELLAQAFGKEGSARAVVRTARGAVQPAGQPNSVLLTSQLKPADGATLPSRPVDDEQALDLNGSMRPYRWGINGAVFGENDPIRVNRGQRVRLVIRNMTMMTHPLHLHGHTFALSDSGVRKDTVLVPPMGRQDIEFDADNVGRWMVHCHNAYHAEAGMMALLSYR